jgi:hypothetical protein
MMIKKIIFVLLIIITYPLAVEARLSKEAIESVGHFLVLDFLTSKSGQDADRKPLTNFFFVKETGRTNTIKKEEINKIELRGRLWRGEYEDIVIPDGEYKEILIINEVSGLGGLKRLAFINDRNQVFWFYESHSLMHFEFVPEMGFVERGVPFIMHFDATYLSELFKDCQKGEIPINWKPTKAQLDFYLKTMSFIYEIAVHRP